MASVFLCIYAREKNTFSCVALYFTDLLLPATTTVCVLLAQFNQRFYFCVCYDPAQYLCFRDLRAGCRGLQFCHGIAESAATGGGKQDDLLAGEIVGFKKCVDERRRDVSPDRVTEVNGVIARNVHVTGDDRRAETLVVHLHAAAGLLIHPIEIYLGVFHLRLDLINICSDGRCQLFSDFRRFAGGGEIGNQFITHNSHSLSECGCPVCFLEADENKFFVDQGRAFYQHAVRGEQFKLFASLMVGSLSFSCNALYCKPLVLKNFFSGRLLCLCHAISSSTV